ncbi:MAG: hypothetical protein HYW25_05460 [Candidatus Aenigmarchaeota archaeon]|nr:hypothetical protein [Candidatus Aenigmarchaeota archaeon]
MEDELKEISQAVKNQVLAANPLGSIAFIQEIKSDEPVVGKYTVRFTVPEPSPEGTIQWKTKIAIVNKYTKKVEKWGDPE